MNVLIIWSGGGFDIAGQPKRWLVVASTMVRDEICFSGDLIEEAEVKMKASSWI